MQEIIGLLYPKFLQLKNRIKYRGKGAYVKALLFGLFGLFFWAGIFTVFCRVLYYFKDIDVLGDFLASKLLSMVFLAFFSILIFSNIITAISSFFMSKELELIIPTPFDMNALYYSKLIETLMNSSWMVLLFCLPVFISYGVIFTPPSIYYVILAATIIPFFVICLTIGVGVAICLIKLFPARRLRDVLLLLALIMFLCLYLLLRVIKPEQLVDPDAFFTVVDYLTALQAPGSPFLPSQWASDILSAFLFNRGTPDLLFNFLLLTSTALAFTVILNHVFCQLFYSAWSESQETKSSKVTGNNLFDRLIEKLMAPFSQAVRAIVEKDIRIFFRDTAQWSQIFILAVIIFIYLYNFSVLPMDRSPIPTFQLQNLIAFLNLGLAGFAISAVAVRFAFTSVSLEGDAFWIIKSSPISMSGFLWCKFWVNYVFLLLFAEILIVCSNYFIRVDTFMTIVSTVTIFFMTFGLTSLSIGCGAIYPRFKHENISQISTGYGGFLYMVLSVLFVGSIVVLEAGPVYLILMSKFTGKALTQIQYAEIAIAFILVLIICTAAFLLPMKIGLKKLSALEEF